MPSTRPPGATRRAPRQRDRRGATSATDVQHDFADPRGGSIEQDLGDRCEQRILRLLPIQPALATGAVPVRDLVGVAVIGGGERHRLSRSGGGSMRTSGHRGLDFKFRGRL